jgi:iron(III) transport system permease protein
MTFIPGLPFEANLSFNNYADVLNGRLLLEIIPNTIFVGVGTCAVALFFALPLAWLLNRTDIPFRSFWITLLATTVIVPGLVKAMGWIMLLSPNVGLINRILMELLNLRAAPLDINGIWGIAYVQGLMLTPMFFFLVAGPMRSVDPVLEEASEMVGTSRWKTLTRITLPVLWPTVLGGLIYVFMTAVAIFEVAGLLGGLGGSPVLATELFWAVQPSETGLEIRYGVAGVYGLLIVVPSLIALYFYFRTIQQAHRYVVITGKGYRSKLFNLGRLRYPALFFVFCFFTLAVFLPLAVLFWASLLPSLQMPSLEALKLVSFRWYRDMFFIIGGFEVIKNTFILVVTTSVLVLFFSFMVSWIVVRTRLPTRRFLDSVAMLPHAIPGLAFAFALLIVGILAAKWVQWLPLYNTIWIIVAANVLNRISYVTRITNAALIQVGQELEDAAVICGARKSASMWHVMVPLVKPSLIFAGLWTALLVFREVSMALLLTGPRNKVIGTQLWILWRQGDLSQAAALSVVFVLTMAVLILILQWMTGSVNSGAPARAEPVRG